MSYVEAMVHFMYGYDYDSSGSNCSRGLPLLFNIEVYRVEDTKAASKREIRTRCQDYWGMDDLLPFWMLTQAREPEAPNHVIFGPCGLRQKHHMTSLTDLSRRLPRDKTDPSWLLFS